MDGTGTSGPEASPPESLRPPEAPDELWGIWWAYGGPGGSGRWLSSRHSALLAYESKEAAQVQVEIEKDDYLCAPRDVTPLLLGVSPAAREQRDQAEKSRDAAISQRDKLGEALAEAEAEIQRELDWLLTIKATDGLKYRHLKECQRRWGILLIEWREAQEREHEGSTADGQ